MTSILFSWYMISSGKQMAMEVHEVKKKGRGSGARGGKGKGRSTGRAVYRGKLHSSTSLATVSFSQDPVALSCTHAMRQNKDTDQAIRFRRSQVTRSG